MSDLLGYEAEIKRPIVGVTSARTRLTNGKRHPQDYYKTPPVTTRAMLKVETFPGPIWEPAAGDGAISVVLEDAGYDVISTDLIDRGYCGGDCDFLKQRTLLAPNVVTNPPFSLADQFVIHALELGARKVVVLQRLAWLEGMARHERLYSKYPPLRVWAFRGRHTLWRGDDPNPQNKGGVMALAWFTWIAGFDGSPSLGWL